MKRSLLTLPFLFLVLFLHSQVFTFEFEGIERDYKVFLPEGYDPGDLHPLVFNLHGLGSNAFEQQLYSAFDLVADTAGVIVVYPNAVNNQWNVFSPEGVNDVGFISALLDTMLVNYGVDPDRVYSTGMSMGGFMSYRLACELDTRIAAIASVTGLLAFSPCEPSRTVPVLQIHGTADPVVPYSFVPLTISFWTQYNNCPAEPVITDLPDIDTTDGSTVTLSYYGLCDDSSEVILYTVNGGEHTWPGSAINIGITNQDIDASTEIWNFFRKYSLDDNLGLADRDANAYQLHLYPNPFREYATLEIHGPASAAYRMRIYDMHGRRVREQEYPHDQRMLLERGGLGPGVYFIELTGKSGRGVLRFVLP